MCDLPPFLIPLVFDTPSYLNCQLMHLKIFIIIILFKQRNRAPPTRSNKVSPTRLRPPLTDLRAYTRLCFAAADTPCRAPLADA